MSRARDLADLGGSANAGTVTGESLIINGDFAVWQRGTSFASPSDGDFTADRYKIFTGNDGDETISQSTDVPSGEGFQYSIKVDITTADTSIAAGQYLTLDQYIEGNVCSFLDWGSSNAKTITVSFWAKSALTGTYCYSIRNSAINRSYVKEFTIDTANTWEKKTITIEGDTTGTWLTTNGIGQVHQISFAMGSTYHGTNDSWQSANAVATSNQVNLLNSNSNDFYLTGWKAEEGTTATPFKHQSYAENLLKCQRYYYRIRAEANYQRYMHTQSTSTTNAQGTLTLPTEMRTRPTLDTTGTASHYAFYRNNAVSVCTVLPLIGSSGSNNQSVNISGTTSAVLTAGESGDLISNNNTSVFLGFNAEL